jgi:hypothetical protein
VPGQLLGWSWPDRLRHALALAAGGASPWTRAPGGADEQEERDRVDLAAYERLLDAVRVEEPAPRYSEELHIDHLECARVWIRLTSSPPRSRPSRFPDPKLEWSDREQMAN